MIKFKNNYINFKKMNKKSKHFKCNLIISLCYLTLTTTVVKPTQILATQSHSRDHTLTPSETNYKNEAIKTWNFLNQHYKTKAATIDEELQNDGSDANNNLNKPADQKIADMFSYCPMLIDHSEQQKDIMTGHCQTKSADADASKIYLPADCWDSYAESVTRKDKKETFFDKISWYVSALQETQNHTYKPIIDALQNTQENWVKGVNYLSQPRKAFIETEWQGKKTTLQKTLKATFKDFPSSFNDDLRRSLIQDAQGKNAFKNTVSNQTFLGYASLDDKALTTLMEKTDEGSLQQSNKKQREEIEEKWMEETKSSILKNVVEIINKEKIDIKKKDQVMGALDEFIRNPYDNIIKATATNPLQFTITDVISSTPMEQVKAIYRNMLATADTQQTIKDNFEDHWNKSESAISTQIANCAKALDSINLKIDTFFKNNNSDDQKGIELLKTAYRTMQASWEQNKNDRNTIKTILLEWLNKTATKPYSQDHTLTPSETNYKNEAIKTWNFLNQHYKTKAATIDEELQNDGSDANNNLNKPADQKIADMFSYCPMLIDHSEQQKDIMTGHCQTQSANADASKIYLPADCWDSYAESVTRKYGNDTFFDKISWYVSALQETQNHTYKPIIDALQNTQENWVNGVNHLSQPRKAFIETEWQGKKTTLQKTLKETFQDFPSSFNDDLRQSLIQDAQGKNAFKNTVSNQTFLGYASLDDKALTTLMEKTDEGSLQQSNKKQREEIEEKWMEETKSRILKNVVERINKKDIGTNKTDQVMNALDEFIRNPYDNIIKATTTNPLQFTITDVISSTPMEQVKAIYRNMLKNADNQQTIKDNFEDHWNKSESAISTQIANCAKALDSINSKIDTFFKNNNSDDQKGIELLKTAYSTMQTSWEQNKNDRNTIKTILLEWLNKTPEEQEKWRKAQTSSDNNTPHDFHAVAKQQAMSSNKPILPTDKPKPENNDAAKKAAEPQQQADLHNQPDEGDQQSPKQKTADATDPINKPDSTIQNHAANADKNKTDDSANKENQEHKATSHAPNFHAVAHQKTSLTNNPILPTDKPKPENNDAAKKAAELALAQKKKDDAAKKAAELAKSQKEEEAEKTKEQKRLELEKLALAQQKAKEAEDEAKKNAEDEAEKTKEQKRLELEKLALAQQKKDDAATKAAEPQQQADLHNQPDKGVLQSPTQTKADAPDPIKNQNSTSQNHDLNADNRNKNNKTKEKNQEHISKPNEPKIEKKLPQTTTIQPKIAPAPTMGLFTSVMSTNSSPSTNTGNSRKNRITSLAQSAKKVMRNKAAASTPKTKKPSMTGKVKARHNSQASHNHNHKSVIQRKKTSVTPKTAKANKRSLSKRKIKKIINVST